MNYLNKEDVEYIKRRGNDLTAVLEQIKLILKGRSFLRLERPATIENGLITVINSSSYPHLKKTWLEKVSKSTTKFVPASGAASRMFKALVFALNQKYLDIKQIKEEIYKLKRKGSLSKTERELLDNLKSCERFIFEIESFPFYDELQTVLKNNGIQIEEELKIGRLQNILEFILTKKGMNYSAKPKLFLTFHKDCGRPRIAMEEHIKEAIWLTEGKIHFTIQPKHLNVAKRLAKYFTEQYKKAGIKLDISLSIQHPSTDVVALTADKSGLHRNDDGSLFFRQGGHGALSMNLNSIETPHILIQNVDNLPGGSEEILDLKRTFMGFFAELEENVHMWTKRLHDVENLSEKTVDEALSFINNDLKRPLDVKELADRNLKTVANFLFGILNRPLTLAAMVPARGEPGGGPFAVRDESSGLVTNQIVESAQQNLSDPVQMEIVKKSTHFNPVFLMIGVMDAWGRRFDLRKYAKREGGYVFFVEKTDSRGVPFKSIDTGLWNGEIADTNIVFAEMPIQTFGPAKTVLDLCPLERSFRAGSPYPEIIDIPPAEVLNIVNSE